MWDQTDGYAKKCRYSIAYYMMSYLLESYQIVIDRAVVTPGDGKDLVHGFNTVQKKYLATCLRMRNTPEVDNIDEKCMRVDAMTNKGEVRSA